MAVITHVAAGDVARSAHQNGLIDQVNSNTRVVETVGTGVFTETDTISSWATQVQSVLDNLNGRPRSGAFFGSWSDNGAGSFGQKIRNNGNPNVDNDDPGPGGRGVKLTDINTVVNTPTGCALNNGTFTSPNAGKWLFTATAQYGGGVSAIRAVYFAKSSAADSPTGTKFGLLGGPSADAQAVSAVINLAANEPVSFYVAVWTEASEVNIWRGRGNTLTAVWIGP